MQVEPKLRIRGRKENRAFLGYYAASGGNFGTTLSVPSPGFKNSKTHVEFLNPENGTDRLSRNVGKKLPLQLA